MMKKNISYIPMDHALEIWLLEKLLREPPENAYTKELIYRAVWEEDYLLDNSNIMAFIRKLRKKIEPAPDSPTYILTIWGIDYKFNDAL